MARIVDSGGGTWLTHIADKIKNVSLQFKGISDSIRDIPLLGKYLYLPFWWVYFYLDLVQDGVRKFQSYYLDVVAGVQDALGYVGLDDALAVLFGEWKSFRAAPTIWFKNKIRDTIAGAETLFTNAGKWVLERIRDFSPTVYAWLMDFPLTFDGWVRTAYPWVYKLFHDPKAFFRELAYEIAYDLGRLLFDTKVFLQQSLSDWLDLPPGFWANPRQGLWDYLLREFEERFQPIAPRVYRLGERILRYFVEGVF